MYVYVYVLSIFCFKISFRYKSMMPTTATTMMMMMLIVGGRTPKKSWNTTKTPASNCLRTNEKKHIFLKVCRNYLLSAWVDWFWFISLQFTTPYFFLEWELSWSVGVWMLVGWIVGRLVGWLSLFDLIAVIVWQIASSVFFFCFFQHSHLGTWVSFFFCNKK